MKSFGPIFSHRNKVRSSTQSRVYAWHHDTKPALVHHYPRLEADQSDKLLGKVQILALMQRSRAVPVFLGCFKGAREVVVVTQTTGPRLLDVYNEIVNASAVRKLAVYGQIVDSIFLLSSEKVAYPLVGFDTLYFSGFGSETIVFGDFEKLCLSRAKKAVQGAGKQAGSRCKGPNSDEMLPVLLMIVALETKMEAPNAVELLEMFRKTSPAEVGIAREVLADVFRENSQATEQSLRKFVENSIRASPIAEPSLQMLKDFLSRLSQQVRKRLQVQAAMNSAVVRLASPATGRKERRFLPKKKPLKSAAG